MSVPEEVTMVAIPSKLVKDAEAVLALRDVSLETFVRLAVKALIRRQGFFNLDSKLTFGKYEGEIVKDAIKVDPHYFMWMLENHENFYLNEEAQDYLATLLNSMGTGKKHGRSSKPNH